MAVIRVIQTFEGLEQEGRGIYYPLWFLRLSATWQRLLLPRRTAEILVCVDGVRGISHRADVLPESAAMDVPEGSVIPLKVEAEAALAGAFELARWWARARLFSWWAPELGVSESHLLHKVYLIEEGPSGCVLKDSVTGETGRL